MERACELMTLASAILPPDGLPAHAPPALLLVVAAAVGLAVAPRRLPPGTGTGAAITALSLAAWLVTAGDASPLWVFTPLAVAWYLLALLGHMSGLAARLDASHEDLVMLLRQAAAVCGAIGLGASLTLSPDRSDAALNALFLLGLSSAGMMVFRARGEALASAAIAVVLATLLIPAEAAGEEALIWGQPAAAGVALALVLGGVIVDYLRRRHVWTTDASRLLEAPPRRIVLHALATLLALATGAAALIAPHGLWSPVALVLGALAAFGAAHRGGLAAARELAPLLLAGAPVAGAAMWIDGTAGLMLGLMLGGGYLLWLGLFWDQQLLDGRAWTTTGAAVPIVRQQACAIAIAALALCGVPLAHGAAGHAGGIWLTLCAAAGAGWALMFLRAARASGDRTSELGSCVAAGLSGVTIAAQLEIGAGIAVGWPLATAAVLSVVSLRAASPLGQDRPGATLAGCLAGGLPVLALVLLIVRGPTPQVLVMIVLCAGIVLTTLNASVAYARRAAAQ
jgi:hypothetical protein